MYTQRTSNLHHPVSNDPRPRPPSVARRMEPQWRYAREQRERSTCRVVSSDSDASISNWLNRRPDSGSYGGRRKPIRFDSRKRRDAERAGRKNSRGSSRSSAGSFLYNLLNGGRGTPPPPPPPPPPARALPAPCTRGHRRRTLWPPPPNHHDRHSVSSPTSYQNPYAPSSPSHRPYPQLPKRMPPRRPTSRRVLRRCVRLKSTTISKPIPKPISAAFPPARTSTLPARQSGRRTNKG